MALASFYAGVALTRATGYVHAVGHNLGSFYNIPHGLAIGIILPHMLEEYGEKCHKKLAELAVYCGFGTENDSIDELAKIFIQKLKDLTKNLGIPNFVEELKEEDIPLLAKRAAKEGNPIYPVPKLLNTKEF